MSKNALSISFYQLLADNLPARGEKIAIEEKGRSVTYLELSHHVDVLAAHLSSLGVMPGDRVVVQLRKSIAEVVAIFAIAKLGAVVVNVNWQWTCDQLEYVTGDCDPGLLILEDRMFRQSRKAQSLAAIPVVIRKSERQDSPGALWDSLCGTEIKDENQRMAGELAMLIYTSGSTGSPKGVMLSNENILYGARAVARYLGLEERDRTLSVLPYSFDYGLSQLTTMMLMGGTVIHQTVPLASEVVSEMIESRITTVAAVPPLWNQIIRYLDSSPQKFPDLRRVTNSGGKIAKGVLEKMPIHFSGADIFLMYGLTEAFRSTYLDPKKFSKKMGSIGQAIPGAQVFVIKHGQGIAQPGEQGELVHRGPLVSMGYWRRPEETAKKIRPCPELKELLGDECVVYSGDMVECDEDGDLWFIGRNDSMIKSSGFRLSPEEVEEHVRRSGLIDEVVAFGVADADLGEVVHIAVAPRGELHLEELMDHCRRVMPPYMLPRQVHVWEESLPLTGNGKLDRPLIVDICLSRND